jgi:4-amino-4-deoxy-L-arabinose transferase-like glycosyltransferase
LYNPAKLNPSMMQIKDIWNRRTRKHLILALLVGLGLRSFFIVYLPGHDSDSALYEELGKNLLTHHTYAYEEDGKLVPTVIRVPVYPIFTSVVHEIFGPSERAILFAQAVLDLGTCFLISLLAALLAMEQSRQRVAIAALWLATTCPFIANYTAVALTEVLATFLTAAALLLFTMAWQSCSIAREDQSKRTAVLWILGAVFTGLGALVRPETPLLLGAVGLALMVRWRRPSDWLRLARTALLLFAGFILPIFPWAVRNWVTLHEFQPLTTPYVQMPGEYIPRGFLAWTHTWLTRYSEMDNVLFKLDQEPILIDDIPSSAFDNNAERARVIELLKGQQQTLNISPEYDRGFAELARERTKRHPLRTYLTIPFERGLTMWFEPRVELTPYGTDLLPISDYWGDFDFWVSCFFGLLGIGYVVLAIAGIYKARWAAGIPMLVTFFVLRTLFIATVHYTPEPRFVLECFPAVLAMGALLWSKMPAGNLGMT